jgi:hypothetical protein
MTDETERCRCGLPLVDEDEFFFGVCESCTEAAAARYQRCRDWAEFHDGEWFDEQAA